MLKNSYVNLVEGIGPRFPWLDFRGREIAEASPNESKAHFRSSSSSLCLSSFFTTMNSNCNLHSAFNSAFNSTLNFRLWTFNYRKHQFPQILRLPISNAVNVPQLFLRLRLRPRDLPERRVVEDDVRRHAAPARDFQAQHA